MQSSAILSGEDIYPTTHTAIGLTFVIFSLPLSHV